MLSALLFVDYQWCHVLFRNNTASKMTMRMIMLMLITITIMVEIILFVLRRIQPASKWTPGTAYC